jgi:hypothetical protein
MADSPITAAAPPVSQVDQGATNSTPAPAPFNDAFADLDKLGVSEQPATKAPAAMDAARKGKQAAPARILDPSPDKPQKPIVEKPVAEKPATDKPAEEEAAPEEKPAEEDSAAQPKTDKPAADGKLQKGPWQMLREAQAKLKELEGKAPAKPDDAASKAAEERLAKLEATLAEKEREIQLADYTKSDDYAKNFLKPFTDAYTEAREAVAQFQLTDPDSGETRQATPADFDALMRVTDPNKAAEMIDSLFGSGAKAAEVAAMRRDIIKLNTRRANQIESKRVEAAENSGKSVAERQKAQGEIAKTYTETLAKLAAERKEFFAPDEDAKGNEILEKSRAIADLAFGKQAEGKPPISPVELAKIHAVIHAKATGFDRLVYRNKVAASKIAELEKELAEFRKSEPGNGDGKSGKPAAKPMSVAEAAEAALEAMAT